MKCKTRHIIITFFLFLLAASVFLVKSSHKCLVTVKFNNQPWSVIALTATKIDKSDKQRFEDMTKNLWFSDNPQKISYAFFAKNLGDAQVGNILRFHVDEKASTECVSSAELTDGVWLLLLISDDEKKCQARVITVGDENISVDFESKRLPL